MVDEERWEASAHVGDEKATAREGELLPVDGAQGADNASVLPGILLRLVGRLKVVEQACHFVPLV